MLSIYGTCAVLAGIAGRNKLLIKKEALVERLVLFCCVRYLRRGAFEGESALGCIPEG